MRKTAISITADKHEIMAINHLARKRGYKHTGDYIRNVVFADGGEELIGYISFFRDGDKSKRQSTDKSDTTE